MVELSIVRIIRGVTSTFRLLRDAVYEFAENDCMTLAASLSYYTIFSLPPLLFTTIAVASYVFGQETVESHVLGQVRQLIGDGAALQVGEMLAAIRDRVAEGNGALTISLGALFFAATGALVQLQTALNRAWEVRPAPDAGTFKPLVVKRLISVGLVVAVSFLLLVSLLLSAAVSAFGSTVAVYFPDQASQDLLRAAELTLSMLLFTVVFAGMFQYLPDARVEWRDAWVGSVFTAFLFTAGKYVLGHYLGALDTGADFGAAGSLAVIMLWVYYASMILLLGAEFTQVWARDRGTPIRPEPGSIRFTYQPAGHPS